MNAKTLVPLVLVLLGFSWALLVKIGLTWQALPLLGIWLSLVFLAFFPLFKENPLATLIGKPLEGGWTFLWLSIPIVLNGLWGIQTQSLSLKHLGATALVVWTPYVFWHLGHLVKDRLLMDLLLLLSLLLPWKFGILDRAWPLGNGQGGFHAIYGILSIHAGVTLLVKRFLILGLPLSHTRKDWIKVGILCLALGAGYFFLHSPPWSGWKGSFRPSLVLEVLTLIVVYGFIEELLFRGFIQNWAKSVTASTVLSISISAGLGAMFSLMPSVGAAAAVGAVAGVTYVWTSSLLVSTIFASVLRAAVLLALF